MCFDLIYDQIYIKGGKKEVSKRERGKDYLLYGMFKYIYKVKRKKKKKNRIYNNRPNKLKKSVINDSVN